MCNTQRCTNHGRWPYEIAMDGFAAPAVGVVGGAAAAAAADGDVAQYFHYLVNSVDGFVNGLYVSLAAIEAIHDCSEWADVLAMAPSTTNFVESLRTFDNCSPIDPTYDRLLHKCFYVATNDSN